MYVGACVRENDNGADRPLDAAAVVAAAAASVQLHQQRRHHRVFYIRTGCELTCLAFRAGASVYGVLPSHMTLSLWVTRESRTMAFTLVHIYMYVCMYVRTCIHEVYVHTYVRTCDRQPRCTFPLPPAQPEVCWPLCHNPRRSTVYIPLLHGGPAPRYPRLIHFSTYKKEFFVR